MGDTMKCYDSQIVININTIEPMSQQTNKVSWWENGFEKGVRYEEMQVCKPPAYRQQTCTPLSWVRYHFVVMSVERRSKAASSVSNHSIDCLKLVKNPPMSRATRFEPTTSQLPICL